ncbi:VOC family protein [Maribacter sp. 2304DJ31-5]|uniref:VOC family protein n=1 Tax=Maribacter sp. 2304DJ31-5 TaxID=3386273 RepID=UPI0039BC94A2
MDLGNFSISLNVKDIKASKLFYESLGYTVFHGNLEQHWLIMKNKTSTVGLFQGMFEKNILTFNPGWDGNAKALESYTDIRELQQQLKDKGIKIETEVDENTTGPASFVVMDPDGNPILIDQHV